MERRNFIKSTAVVASALLSRQWQQSSEDHSPDSGSDTINSYLNHSKKPLAIAMWDFSWILRHHRYGEFEHWNNVLEGLAERGYNAIRMDAMPQYVSSDMEGKVTEQFRSIRDSWKPVKWGNDYSMNFRPREGLLEFLPECKKHGIKVGLATWFLPHGGPRDVFSEKGGLARAWIETLTFLQQHGLLDDNIIYVDLLNEYPFWHGYDWLKKELDSMGNIKQFKLNNPDANIPDNPEDGKKGTFNALQKEFYANFANDTITALQQKISGKLYHFSFNKQMPLDQIDLSKFGVIDYHLWFADTGKLPGLDALGDIDQSKDNAGIFQGLLSAWKSNLPEMTRWMDQQIKGVSDMAEFHHIPCGNTEGWGPISWLDYPDTDWKWVKEAGSICVDLAKKHNNYKFICSSNFTHPQFKGIWEDIKWHKNITSRIKA
jgi:hypothetical protein